MASLRLLNKTILLWLGIGVVVPPAGITAAAVPADSIHVAAIDASGSDIGDRIAERWETMPRLKNEAWENPALIGSHYSTSLSSVGAGFTYSPRDRYGEFRADTYLRLGKVTVDAMASYHNGARHDLKVCENADLDKVYPYLTYDTIGGNQNMERYLFGGKVGVRLSDRWTAGGGICYDAGLLYRNRDPRPRIVTGNLSVTAGGAFSLSKSYTIGVAGRYEKYKQSCEISFMSELGASTIYHLTGLGEHYNRFAGRGADTFWSGDTFGANVTLLPSSPGLYASAGIATERITQILEDLNNLPMSRIRGKRYSLEAGYMWRNAGVTAYVDISRRHGYENIFGDATSDQYPQIGSLCMHLANADRAGLKGAADLKAGRVGMAISGQVEYSRYSEHYRLPAKTLRLSSLSPSLDFTAWLPLGHWLLHGAAGYGCNVPLSSSAVNLTAAEGIEGFAAMLNDGFRQAATFSQKGKLMAGADLAISSGRYAIGLEAEWQRRLFTGNACTLTATFRF